MAENIYSSKFAGLFQDPSGTVWQIGSGQRKGVTSQQALQDWFPNQSIQKISIADLSQIPIVGYLNVGKKETGIAPPGQVGKEVVPEQTTARFGEEDTVYLYNKEEKTYRPITSPTALANLLGVSEEEAFSYVHDLSDEDRDTPEWQGSIISDVDAIKDDGVIPMSSTTVEGSQVGTSIGLKNLYGKTQAGEEDENQIAKLIGFILTDSKLKGAISDETFKKYLTLEGDAMAKYVNAALYGGYSLPDIYRDLKAKDLYEVDGDERYKDFKGFDEEMSAESWYKTEDGKKSLTDGLLAPPANLTIADDLWKMPIFKIPDEAFATLVEPIDITSPEFKEEAEKIQASYYDIMMQKAEAQTEQAKAVADNNWKIFKENIQKKLGIELSDSANTAWNQLQEAFSGYAKRGLRDSGLFNEAMDKYLGSVRKSDELKREGKIKDEEIEQRNHLLKYGSSEEIANFVNANPEKAIEWGLVPDTDTVAWFSKSNLKSLYPDMSDEEIDVIIGMVIDESGNFKSETQQNLYTNLYNLGEQKKTYQEQKLFEKKKFEEEKAYRPYTAEDSMSSYLDEVQEKIEGEEIIPEVPTEEVPTEEAPTLTGQQTLINVYQSRPDVKKTVEKTFPGQDPFRAGTQANTWLNNWWNTAGKSEFPGVTLIQPKAEMPVEREPVTEKPVPTPVKDTTYTRVWKDGKSVGIQAWQLPDYQRRGYTTQKPVETISKAIDSLPSTAPTAPTAPTIPTVPTVPTVPTRQKRTLTSIWDERKDLQKAFPTKGRALDDWWNKYGKKEFPDVDLI